MFLSWLQWFAQHVWLKQAIEVFLLVFGALLLGAARAAQAHLAPVPEGGH